MLSLSFLSRASFLFLFSALIAVPVPVLAAKAPTPVFQVSVTASPSNVQVKQTETLTATVTSDINASSYNIAFAVSLNGTNVATHSFTGLDFTANTPVTETFDWTVPAKAMLGAYVVTVEVKKSGVVYGSGTAGFTVGPPPVNGVCGSSNGADLTSAPSTNLCSTGTASAVTGSGPWNWTCTGSNGGTTAQCMANLLVNGECGPANGETTSTAPTTGLCSAGTASAVTGTGPWTWMCVGQNDGATAPCEAYVTSTGQSLQSIMLSGTSFVSGSNVTLPSGSYIGTLSTVMNPTTPVFSGSYQLVSSGGSCSGGDTTHFEIYGDALEVKGAPPVGTYTICVEATEGGNSLVQGFTLTGGNLINATDYCAANGGGSGSTSSPWRYNCIQAAVNAASDGDTVFLAGGNWELSTGDATYVNINKAINLVGAGSGNTFDVWGHVNNASGGDMCPTSGTSITCVYMAGKSYLNAKPGAGAGYIFTGSLSYPATTACLQNIEHIFFDGSLTTRGGDYNALLTLQYCSGTVINDVRFLAYNEHAVANAETQINPYLSENFTAENSVFADPASGIVNSYPNAQVLQITGGNGIGSNFLIRNNVFYQGALNPIVISNVTYTGNIQLDYQDSLSNTGIDPDWGEAGSGMGGEANDYCPQTGILTGQCDGDLNTTANNNLFYSPGNGFAAGSAINDPTTSGGLNNLILSGNWIITSTGALDSCVWHIYDDEGNCAPGNAVGMTLNTSVDVNCNESYNSPYLFSMTNNSIIATVSAQLNGEGSVSTSGASPTDWINCKLGDPYEGSNTLIPIKVYGFNAQNNYLSSPSNQYLTNANTINPTQVNNFCSGGAGTVTGCATSGFTTYPSASFAIGPLTYDPVQQTNFVLFTATNFAAQYGAVQWLASTSSTPPTSSDSRWSSNDPNFPDSAPNTYVPPAYLPGVAHGDTVYLWVMDSAGHISAGASALIP